MNDSTRPGIHWSFWIIGVVALIWNLLGCANFFTQLNPESVAAAPEPYRLAIENRPVWATTAFAIAVFTGALGCLLLLLRRAAAWHLFVVSLVAAFVTVVNFHSIAGFDPISAAIGSLMQLVVSAFLIWYARQCLKWGWIR